ncbi:MAG: hypothetical protein C0392_04395 [Syntrophus sp. (in: bacteria)]|nr:hypothetical protein [Syntrophus sp. (in: bacteria)]
MTGERKLITLRDIFYIFFKNKTLIILIFLVAVIGALLYCVLTPAKYRAETKILVRMGKAQVSGMEQFRPEQYNILFQERTQNIRNEMEVLRGEYLSEQVVQRLRDKISTMKDQRSLVSLVRDGIRQFLYITGVLKQAPSPVDRGMVSIFMNSLNVTYLEDTDMIRLTFDWTDPRFAALVANTYADEYLTQHTRIYETKRSHSFYNDQIELFQKKLQDAEDELQNYISKSNLVNIELQKEILLRNLGELNNRYNLVMVDYAQATTKLKKVQEMSRASGSWIETPESGPGNTQLDKQAYLRTLDESYFKLKVEKERLLKNYTPLSNEIKALDLQLNNLRRQKSESLMNIIGMELSLVANKRDSLQREIAGESKKIDEINAKTFTLKQLQRNREIIEANFQIYKKKGEDLRISDDLDTKRISSVKIAEPAVPPLGAAYPRKALIMGMAAFIGLFFGFGFSAVREFFNHTFKDDENVSSYLGVPLLMSIPLHLVGAKQTFFGNLSKAAYGVRSKASKNVKKTVAYSGQVSMENANSLVLVLLSVTTLCFSGYFFYTEYFIPSSNIMIGLDNKSADNEKYLAQGTIQGAVALTGGAGHYSPPAGAEVVPSSKSQVQDVHEHIVSHGQTLINILKNVYHVPDDYIFDESIDLIKAANPHMKSFRNLFVGQKIRIPVEVIEKGKGSEGLSNRRS